MLQKQPVVVSQGNCMGAVIKSKSDEQGMMNFIHHTNSLNNWRSDRTTVFDYGDSTCYLACPFLGPKPKNKGDVLQAAADKMQEENDNIDIYYSTPAVQLVTEGGKVTGDYQNNEAMVKHFHGPNVDADHPDGSKGWYCQVYDADYMNYANGPFYGGADYPYHATGLSLGRCAAFGWAAAKHACTGE